MTSCVIADCGDLNCKPCWWGRQPQPKLHSDQQKRDRAELKDSKALLAKAETDE